MASSSSAISCPNYDVFLSFRGVDTRNNFTSHLYNALHREGINAFMDKELNRGEQISSALFLLIQNSKISIIVFSPNYAESKFCLDELVKILKCKESRQQVVLPVFYKVDPSEVKKLTGDYGKAISSHEAEFKGFRRWLYSNITIKEKMEKVKRWKLALAEAADLSGWDSSNRDEVELIEDIVKQVLIKLGLLQRGRFEQGLGLDEPQSRKELFPEKTLVGKNFEINNAKIWEWLTDSSVSSIGIWGMGGVGKTSLLIHIYNRLLDKQDNFGPVYWVTVSQDFSVSKLQNLIAQEIGLEIGTEENVMRRAARMSKTLSSKEKYVLILDDLWNHFEAEMVGIPINKKGCQLIITTRILSICTQMNLQKLNKIEPLSEEEAWYLFNERLGHDLATNIDVIAKFVVRECDGLPLGIETMAGSMRGVDDIHEWQNALTELRRSEVRPENMGDKVFRVLEFSYTRLNDWNLQQCVLYCALYPEDDIIYREQLIDLLVVEGIIERQESRRVDFDKGHAMLNNLVKVSLLEDVEIRGQRGRHLKMHDLIRDMAIQVMKKSSPSMVKARRELEHIPEEKYWTKEILRVSLIKNDIKEIPSNFSPICHSLSTLLFSRNWKLSSIPEAFFLLLHGLKVTELSCSRLGKLPQSVACLRNLKALLLRRCIGLYDMPSLVKLESLEILDLSFSRALRQVPKGLELLSRLTWLNLNGSGIKKLPGGMVRRLSHLQFLAFSGPTRAIEWKRSNKDSSWVKAEELAESKLECLSWWFNDFGEYIQYVQLVSRMQSANQLISYFLSVGTGHHDRRNLYPDGANSREVFFWSCDIGRELFIPEGLRVLRLNNVVVYDGSGLCFKIASAMKSFEPEQKSLSMFITSCGGIVYLFDLSSSPSIFENLETLDLNYMHKLCALFGGEEVTSSTATPLLLRATTFSFLKKFRIINCNGIKKLFPPGLIFNFKNLEMLVVGNCPELEEIIAAVEDEASYHYNHSNFTETYFSLPKFRHLKLIRLPKLRSICSAHIVCDSSTKITIGDCPKLKKIPISFTLQSLQTSHLSVWPPEWWDSVEWGNPDQKCFLQPQFDSSMFGRRAF